jgi:hypothetical protein
VARVTTADGCIEIDVHVDPQAEPVREPDVVAFMRVGMLSTWKFSLS